MASAAGESWWPKEPLAIFENEFSTRELLSAIFDVVQSGSCVFDSQPMGDAVWLTQNSTDQEPKPQVFERDRISSHLVVPAFVQLRKVISVDTTWFEDHELGRIRNHVVENAQDMARQANKLLLATLDLSSSAESKILVSGMDLGPALANSADILAENGHDADVLVIPHSCLHRLRQSGTILTTTESKHKSSVGITQTGLRAFTSQEIPQNVGYILDSRACLAPLRVRRFQGLQQGEYAFSLGLRAIVEFNLIVKDRSAVIKLEGFGKASEAILQQGGGASYPASGGGQAFLFVDSARIAELRNVTKKGFDLTKLIRFCEELNECHARACYLAVAMLTRAIMDHVPPIFGCKSFTEVVNSYSWPKSNKESIKNLENSLRHIANAHLHVQIRSQETLPNASQVGFRSDLDVLLAEIVRILK